MRIDGPAISTISTVPKPNVNRLRDDFARDLEQRVQRFLGAPGSPQRERMEKLVEPLMEDGRLSIDRLPDSAKKELTKLQEAAEGIESLFVKDLLSRMRRTTFSGDKSAMEGMAQDWMDDAVSKSIAQSANSMGVGKTVFMSTGERLVQEALGSISANAPKS